jgi:DNA-binding GntR family transcriptional regulator
MEKTTTDLIVSSLTRAIVERRLLPGTKLVEQKLADHFEVSRTVVRQAFFQLAQNRLVRMEQQRGAYVATPSVEEARQVFAVRRMLEAEMVRQLVPKIKKKELKVLRTHLKAEGKAVVNGADALKRTELLGDFHVVLANSFDNYVLAQILKDLISRCALITLMYQSRSDAKHSNNDHVAIVDAIEANDVERAVEQTVLHLQAVEASLIFDRIIPSNNLSIALL